MAGDHATVARIVEMMHSRTIERAGNVIPLKKPRTP
jgi:hypothetical protein